MYSPVNFDLLRRLYIDEYKSTTEIGKILGKCRRTVNYQLHCMGVELRSRTVRRICKIPWCGKECLKKPVSNGRMIVFSGSLCREHTAEYWRKRSLARRQKSVYSKTQGTESAERKPIKPIGSAPSSSTATV